MEQWIGFAKDHWLVIAAAIVAIFVIIGILKTVVKWAVVLVIIGALCLYGYNNIEHVKEVGKDLSGKLLQFTKDEAVDALIGEAKEAKYAAHEDGTFVVTARNLKLEGKAGSANATITFKGQSFAIKLDDRLKQFIEEAKNAGS